MPLTKSKGNMYDWCDFTHTHLRGECSHRCSYCYVQAMEKRFGGGHYAGELRLKESEFNVNYGSGCTIFIEHCNDLFAADVPDEWIQQILMHCAKWPDNTYVFQTKNPGRYSSFLPMMPVKRVLGCTIESTDDNVIRVVSSAPSVRKRSYEMRELRRNGEDIFITIEPILRGCDMLMVSWLEDIKPNFVNIGADSKKSGLPEPSPEELRMFLDALKKTGLEIRKKVNLERLLQT